jgi:RNA polymerase sigma factor (sigma-70 family)
MTDRQLINRFRSERSELAFRELYARHAPSVYGFLRRLTGASRHQADDLMQEAWLRAVAQITQFRGESSFRTWLTGIALNCYREMQRRERRPTERLEDDPGDSRPESVSERLDVATVLERLSPEHRAVLVLYDIEGYTHDEIARALSVEVGTSKSRLSRARQAFRDHWRG